MPETAQWILPMPEKIELPVDPKPSEVGADYYFQCNLQKGRFLIQRCTGCRRSVFFPRMICPHCGDGRLEWYAPSGDGVVYSTTVVRRKAEKGGDYNVALVDLKEGVRMMSRVEGVPPDQVRIGQAVKARIIAEGDGNLVVFTPAEGAK
jgi:uncharacterized OB-fold protein